MTHKKPAGRTGAQQEARDLLALLASLSSTGDAIDADTVARRLSIPHDRAQRLLYLLATASTQADDDGYLPLSYEDMDHVELSFDQGVRGRAVRLSQTEIAALVQALREAGLDKGDELIRHICQAFSPLDEVPAAVADALDMQGEDQESAILSACAGAISDEAGLIFDYQALSSASDRPSLRNVAPESVYKSQEFWYLLAIDQADNVEKRFRIDRMSNVHQGPKLQDDALEHAVRQERRSVRVTFHGRRALDLFWWDGLSVISRDGEDIEAMLPYYGGQWLIRHLAACGDAADIHDPEIARAVSDYARGLLDSHHAKG